MGNRKTSQQQPQHRWSALKLFLTFGAGLIAAVPLFNLAGAGAEKLVGFGKIQSTVEMQAKLITDLQAEKKGLSEKAEGLLTKSQDLQIKLNSSELNLSIANQQLAQLSKDLGEYKIFTAQLTQRIKAIDPCLSIQNIIADLEKRLGADQGWSHSLSGARREDAMSQLEKHQQSLRSCLARAS